MRLAVRVLDAAVAKAYTGQRKIAWMEVYAGEKSFRQFKTRLPDERVEAFRGFLVGVKGPLSTPVGGGFRSLNVTLRQFALQGLDWTEAEWKGRVQEETAEGEDKRSGGQTGPGDRRRPFRRWASVHWWPSTARRHYTGGGEEDIVSDVSGDGCVKGGRCILCHG